jgi:AMP-polyphosphate phosphotransferase
MASERIRLEDLDQEKSLKHEDYRKLLKNHQLELLNAQLILRERKRSVIVVVEGPDAAGKGGGIKRLTERLDPRIVRVHAIVKPTPEEFERHYLWRFWTKLLPHGQIAVFDRSWYGRVLVERVEKFCTQPEWMRAYEEINTFERQLSDDGVIFVKLFLQITKDEQLSRFKRREDDPYKHWKISEEDWRNRRHWNEHNQAAEDMFEKTSTDLAPWTVLPANYKWYARVKMVEAVAKRVSKALEI